MTTAETFVTFAVCVLLAWALWKPGPQVHPAQEAWDRGDATYVFRHKSTWTTSSWASSDRYTNRQVAEISAIGWQLTSGAREPLHGVILFTFVRPT
ncbi:MAG TPA: hypothetical protein VF244_02805 [Acidimicrobiales bacterium]